jgi:hypothetical protein
VHEGSHEALLRNILGVQIAGNALCEVEDPVLISFADLAKSSPGVRHEGISSVDLRGTALDRGCTRVIRAGCGTNVAVHRTATDFVGARLKPIPNRQWGIETQIL